MKDEGVAVLIFLASVLMDTRGLYISQRSATKSVNDTFFVLCRDDAGSSVQWRGPKGILGPKTRPSVKIASYGTTVIFNSTIVEDSGTYTCKAGKEQAEFHLTIEAPLKFMDTDVEQEGVENKDVVLKCEVSGGKVTWSVDDGDLTDTNKFVTMGDGLLIRNVHRSDSKNYVCKAVQQSTGIVVDKKIKLKVLHQPRFPHPRYAEQEIVYGYINGTVNLTCIMIANPPATFEWMKSSDRKKKVIGDVINESDDVSVLRLHVHNSTYGDYKCIAKNKYGRLEKYFSLQQGAKPQPPQIVDLKEATADALNLEIRGPDESGVETGMETKGFNVMYKKVGEDEWYSREYNVTEDDTYQLDNLQDSMKYEIRVATRNPAGLSDYSNSSLYETLLSEGGGVEASLPSIISLITTLLITFLIFW